MDVSFISLSLVVPVVRELLKDGGEIMCLIKPQFEAGKGKVGKKGVVREPEIHCEVIRKIIDLMNENQFRILGLDYSPIKGPEGNIEYLGDLRKGTHTASLPDPAEVVARSHMNLEKIR